jgi:hypothetical protein
VPAEAAQVDAAVQADHAFVQQSLALFRKIIATRRKGNAPWRRNDAVPGYIGRAATQRTAN